MKFLIMQFSPTSPHFITLQSKYSPQHPAVVDADSDDIHRERFGLYQVNFGDPIRHRVPKLSARVFSEITQKRQVPLCIHGCPEEMNSHSSAVSFNRIFISIWMLIMMYTRFIFLP
jgi:hypothetical protein